MHDCVTNSLDQHNERCTIYIYRNIYIYIYIYSHQETAYAELRVDSGTVDPRGQSRLHVVLEVVIVHESFCIAKGIPEGVTRVMGG